MSKLAAAIMLCALASVAYGQEVVIVCSFRGGAWPNPFDMQSYSYVIDEGRKTVDGHAVSYFGAAEIRYIDKSQPDNPSLVRIDRYAGTISYTSIHDPKNKSFSGKCQTTQKRVF